MGALFDNVLPSRLLAIPLLIYFEMTESLEAVAVISLLLTKFFVFCVLKGSLFVTTGLVRAFFYII